MRSQWSDFFAEQQENQVLPSILGVALPMVAGTMMWWVPPLWGYRDFLDDPAPGSTVIIVSLLFAFAGGALLRSWWALLIVPAAWIFGELLYGLVAEGGITWPNFWGALFSHVGLPALVLAGCAALGVLFSQWLAQRGTQAPVHTT